MPLLQVRLKDKPDKVFPKPKKLGSLKRVRRNNSSERAGKRKSL